MEEFGPADIDRSLTETIARQVAGLDCVTEEPGRYAELGGSAPDADECGLCCHASHSRRIRSKAIACASLRKCATSVAHLRNRTRAARWDDSRRLKATELSAADLATEHQLCLGSLQAFLAAMLTRDQLHPVFLEEFGAASLATPN